MSETNERLPVNIREITQTQHVVLRLEQLQRMILKDPRRFHDLDGDRGLNHIRSEVKQLQSRLRIVASKDVLFELKVLNEATDLLSNWEEEKELADVIVADRHTRETLILRNNEDLDYPALCELAGQIRQVRQKMFNKYKGYFSGLLQDNEDKRRQVEKQLQQTLPKIKEYQEKSEQLQNIHGQVLNYHQQSMHALVGGLALMLAMGYGGWWFWKGWGVLPCLMLGYLAFSNIAHYYTYITGKPVEALHAFLTERYDLKNIKPFFKYEDKQKPEQPTCFDASRGEALARFLHKDILVYQQAFNVQERRREEFINYLSYLDGRGSWIREQQERMERLENLRKGDKLPERGARHLPPAAPPLPGNASEMPNLATHLGLRPLIPQAQESLEPPLEKPTEPIALVPAEVPEDAPEASPQLPEAQDFAPIPPLPEAGFVPIPTPTVPEKPKFNPKPIKVLRRAAGTGAADAKITPSAQEPP